MPVHVHVVVDLCVRQGLCYISLSRLSYCHTWKWQMLRVCACRPPPPTLTDSDEQQHECGYRQWSDKLIDFPTVSMKSPGETVYQRQSYNNEGNANDSLFYLSVRNCESHKRAQARIPPWHSFCHIITRHREAPLQNSATDVPGIVGGIFRKKKRVSRGLAVEVHR